MRPTIYSLRDRVRAVLLPLKSFVAIFLLSALLLGCRNLIDRETPIEAADGIVVMEWKSEFNALMQDRFQVSLMADGSMVVIADRKHDRYDIERISRDFDSVLWSEPLELRVDEGTPMIISGTEHTFLITQKEQKGDARSVYLREIDSADGTAMNIETLIDTERGFGRELEAVASPDSTYLLLYGLGDEFDVRDEEGDKIPARPLATVILNTVTGDHRASYDTVVYYDDYESEWWPKAVVSNDGSATILEMIEDDDEVFDLFLNRVKDGEWTLQRSRIPNRRNEILPGVREKNDRYRPGRPAAGISHDGTIVAAWTLRDGSSLEALAGVRIAPDHSTITYSVPFIYSETAVRQVTGDRESRLRDQEDAWDIAFYPSGAYTLVTYARVHRSLETKNFEGRTVTETSYSHYPFLLLHFDHEGNRIGSSWIQRNEVWRPAERSYFEGGHSLLVEGNILHILTRERYFGGVIVYRVDPATGTVETKKIARLGFGDFLGINFTSWSRPGVVNLFVKNKAIGEDWQIVRSTF